MELFPSRAVQAIKKSSQTGFTLVELVVVIIIVGVIFVSLAVLFNPIAQIARSQNATRQHDLEQIKSALDAYMSDTGCYPTSVGFGFSWSGSGGGVYMKKVPQDPTCNSDGTNCYVYQTDTTSSCPQWNVVYAKLASPIPKNTTCPLQAKDNCIPPNFSTINMNYCVLSGNTDCSYVASNPIVEAVPSGPVPTPTPVNQQQNPTNTPIPNTPTPATCAPGNYFACTGVGAQGCNAISPDNKCSVLGGNLQCYCTSNCSVNGVVQCH